MAIQRVRPFRRAAVVFATHGNELAGPFVAMQLEEQDRFAEVAPSMECSCVEANPEAHEQRLDELAAGRRGSGPATLQACARCELARGRVRSLEGPCSNPRALLAFRTPPGAARLLARRVRFVDVDLNRQFSAEVLASPASPEEPREIALAKALDKALGPKSSASPAQDLVIDLHTTTSNMGMTLVVQDMDSVSIGACAAVKEELEADGIPTRILWERTTREESPYLFSLGRHGVLVEVGPIATGIVEAGVVADMREATERLLEFFQRLNDHGEAARAAEAEGREAPPPAWGGGPVEVYEDLGIKVAPPQPLEDDVAMPMFHAELQDQDWVPLRVGQGLFELPCGEVITYKGEHGDDVVPIFVNEAGYQNASSGVGFGLARKTVVDTLPVVVEFERS